MTTKRRERVEPGVYRRADGRLEIGFRDSTGRQRWRVVEGGIIAARRQLDVEKGKRAQGERIADDPRLTFNAAADAWLDARVARLRPNSQATYRNHLAALRKRFGRSRLTAITPADVATYVAELDRAGASGWTQRGRLTVLSGVITYAGRHLGHTGVNPVSLLDRVERPDVDDEREHRILTDDELAAILDHAGRHRLLLATAAQTGARKGEVLGLTWGNVDTQARRLSIEMQLDRKARRVELKTKRSKRTVAITPDLATALAEERLAAGRPGDHELVFMRPGGRPHSHASADLALARAVKAAGITPAPTWHDLRHSHVSRLFAADRDPVYIATRVGDAVATVLSTYAHEYADARRRASESDDLAALYDRGSVMEAPDADAAQQTATAAAGNVRSLSAKRSAAQ